MPLIGNYNLPSSQPSGGFLPPQSIGLVPRGAPNQDAPYYYGTTEGDPAGRGGVYNFRSSKLEPVPPVMYKSAGGAINEALRRIYGEFDPSSASPYEASPGSGRLLDMMAALGKMSSTRSNDLSVGGGRPSLLPQDIAGMGAPASSALLMQEPGRLNALIAAILQGYMQTGSLVGSKLGLEGKAREMESGRMSAQGEQVSRTPIIGGILSGTGFR